MIRRTKISRFALPVVIGLAVLVLGFVTNSNAVHAADEITGTVLTLDGRGVANARVVATIAGQEPRFTQTNPAGRFRFPDLPAGQSCTFIVTHKVLTFDQRVLTVSGSADLAFTAKPTQTGLALDQSFGTGGKVVTDMGGNDRGLAVFGQADGKIVVVGFSNAQGAIARYLPDGTLDATFGAGGKVISPNLTIAVDLNIKPGALQPDNKIVMAGRNATSDFQVERREVNGALDPTFGIGGVVTFEFGPGSTDIGKAVGIQPDGKIVAAGTTNFGTVNAGIGVVRFNSDGTVDTGFGTSGRIIVDTTGVDDPRMIAFQPDGKILVAGMASSTRPMLVRLNADGTRDATFGDNGITTSLHSGGGYDLSLQRDGKIVLIGESLSRFGSNGAPDAAFNGPGGGVGVSSTELQTVALRSDGVILAGGRSFFGANDGSFGLALIHPFTGALVTRVETDILTQRFDDPKDILVQSDGRIVMAGYTVPTTISDFALVRYVSTP